MELNFGGVMQVLHDERLSFRDNKRVTLDESNARAAWIFQDSRNTVLFLLIGLYYVGSRYDTIL